MALLVAEAVAHAPLVAESHLNVADLCWRLGERDRAIELAKHALRLDLFFELAWNRLLEWAAQLDRIDDILALVKSWTVKRPGEPRVWLRLAQVAQLQSPAAIDDAISAYERGALLKRHCEAKLREAQSRVDKIVMGPDGVANIEKLSLE